MRDAIKVFARVTGKCAGGSLLACALLLGAFAGVMLALAGMINEGTDV